MGDSYREELKRRQRGSRRVPSPLGREKADLVAARARHFRKALPARKAAEKAAQRRLINA